MTTFNSAVSNPSIALHVARLEQLAQTAKQVADAAQDTAEANTATAIAATLQNTVGLMQQGLAAEDDLEQLLLLLVASKHLIDSLPDLDMPI